MAKNEVDVSSLSAEEYYVDVNEIPNTEPLPKQDYVAEVLDYKYLLNEKGEVRLSFSYNIPIEQYPPDYDVDNAPDGTRLFTPFGGYEVDCGHGSQATRRGAATVAKVLRDHGFDGRVRFTRRDDLQGAWGVGDECLAEISGKRVILSIKHNTYQGETRAQIGSVKPAQD